MNKNNFEFNVVSIDQRNSESLVVFEINKVSSIVRKTNVGQYVKSKPFELNYPTSIGKSKWNIILFLNGQYEHGGMPNDVICIYLKMLHCEQQSSAFKFDVKFQLGINCATETKKNQSVCFNNVRTRWIGTKLINTNEMILKGSRYIQNDTLFLSVHLNENFPKHLSVETFPEASYNNNNLIERESYAKSGNDFKSTNTPRIPSPSSNHRFSNQSNTVAVYDNYLYNSPQNAYNANASTNPSSSLTNNRKPICDSNLNYVDNMVNNEFSDDEDVGPKLTDSKNGLFSNIMSGIQSFFGKSNSN